MPRESGMRSGRPGCFAADAAEREQRERLVRKLARPPAERLYYRVFGLRCSSSAVATTAIETCRAS